MIARCTLFYVSAWPQTLHRAISELVQIQADLRIFVASSPVPAPGSLSCQCKMNGSAEELTGQKMQSFQADHLIGIADNRQDRGRFTCSCSCLLLRLQGRCIRPLFCTDIQSCDLVCLRTWRYCRTYAARCCTRLVACGAVRHGAAW